MILSSSDKKEGYSSIPEVDEEQGHLVQDNPSETVLDDSLTLAEKYPEANEQERAFLGALDNAIGKCSQPRVTLPTILYKDLGPPDSPQAFLDSLRIPTVALIASLTVGATAIVVNSPIYIALFPYVSCILAFIGSIPPIRKRFRAQTQIILTRIQSQKQSIESKVVNLSNNAIHFIDIAESFMDDALKPIKEKLDKVTELEETLRIVDPTIDIPDVSDIEEAFDGCTDQIRGVVDLALKAVSYSTSRAVPTTFKSQSNLDKSIFYPTLAILLGIQLFGVYASIMVKEVNEGKISGIGSNTTDFVGEDKNIFGIENKTPDFVGQTESVQSMAQLEIMIVSIQTYLTTILQLILAYIASNLSAIAKKINSFIKSIEIDVNQTLDKNIGGTFSLVFDEGLGGVRTKILKLIKDMEKIEGPLNKAREMSDYKAKMQALKDKARAEAEAKAREAEKKLQEARELAEAKAKEAAENAKAEVGKKIQGAKDVAKAKAREAKQMAKAEAENKRKEAKEAAIRKKEEAKRKADQAKAAMGKVKGFGKSGGFGL
jgi:hypothetical protein